MAHPLCHCCTGQLRVFRPCGVCLEGSFDWCGYGIRDPSLLMTPEGQPLIDPSGRYWLYVNGRDRAKASGGITQVGLAVGTPHSGWDLHPNPVFQDEDYAAQGCVMRVHSDLYHMYYSPNTRAGFSLAVSADGVHWEKAADQGYILEVKDFDVTLMGLPYVLKIQQKWVMVFEGWHQGRFHIYLAYATDGVAWHPGNGGKPLYRPDPQGWDSYGQANPSLYEVEADGGDPSYFILYNGCQEDSAWDIGILQAETIEGPWRGLKAPLLRRGPQGTWDGGRIEGARFLEGNGRFDPCFIYFGLPSEDSYANGKIGIALLEKKNQY